MRPATAAPRRRYSRRVRSSHIVTLWQPPGLPETDRQLQLAEPESVNV
jgi:hypothetical protein